MERPFDLARADLSKEYLVKGDLRKATLRGASVKEAVLVASDLSGADLVDADLSGANLIGAVLVRAVLIDTDLTGANLDFVDLSEATVLFSDFSGTRAADIPWRCFGWGLIIGRFAGASIAQADFSSTAGCPCHTETTEAQLDVADFAGAYLVDANFSGADLDLADFSGAIATRATFANASLEGTNFRGADLRGANWQGARFGRRRPKSIETIILAELDDRFLKRFSEKLMALDIDQATLKKVAKSKIQAALRRFARPWEDHLTDVSGADLQGAQHLRPEQLGRACADPGRRPKLDKPLRNVKIQQCPQM